MPVVHAVMQLAEVLCFCGVDRDVVVRRWAGCARFVRVRRSAGLRSQLFHRYTQGPEPQPELDPAPASKSIKDRAVSPAVM